MKRFTVADWITFSIALLILATVMFSNPNVKAQAAFQISLPDWEVAVQAIPRHSAEVLDVINECFADKAMQDKVAADGFKAVLQVKLESKAEHTSKRSALQDMLTGGDIVIEIEGSSVTVDRMTIVGRVLKISKD